MKSASTQLAAAAVVAAAIVAWIKRPVQQPEPEGRWQPAEQHKSRH